MAPVRHTACGGFSLWSHAATRRCNEFGFFSAGAPQDHPSLVSRFLTIERSEVGFVSP